MLEQDEPDTTGGAAVGYEKISLIESGVEPDGCQIFIGGTDAARDIGLLRRRNIAVVVNCTINLDINYVLDPAEPAKGDSCACGVGPLRVIKLGWVDGPGNTEDMILGGYYLLDGALRQKIPNKDTYPRQEKGNVLVHCRGGRSRSTALVALFLHLDRPEKFPTLDCALEHVRKKRGLSPDEWPTAPKPVLVQAARRAAECVKEQRRRAHPGM